MKSRSKAGLPFLSCVSGDTKSTSLESELVLLTSNNTSLFGSALIKLRHWNVRWPAGGKKSNAVWICTQISSTFVTDTIWIYNLIKIRCSEFSGFRILIRLMDISIQLLPYDMLGTFTSEILLRNIVKKEGYTFISISLLMCILIRIITWFNASICNRYDPCDNFFNNALLWCHTNFTNNYWNNIYWKKKTHIKRGFSY